MQPYQTILNYMLCFLGALAVGLFSIPNIIFVAKRKRLLDIPDNNRKLHARVVPNLGGVGIFIAYIIITSLFINPALFSKWNYIAASCLILFVTGLKDDLVSISPSKKFIAQFAASGIAVYFADIRLESLYGLFGIYELPYIISLVFSVVGCMFVTNAFNLIDGIDGLAGSISLFGCLIFGLSFAFAGHSSEAIIAFSMLGAIAGFLRYNIAPARIFMGDTGSLLLGFVLSTLGILFVKQFAISAPGFSSFYIKPGSGALLLALAVLFIPIFDTFRVFSRRISQGNSPFKADRTHLHHYLLDLGFTHTTTVVIILIMNVAMVVLAIVLQPLNINLGIAILGAVGLSTFLVLVFTRRAKYNAHIIEKSTIALQDDKPLQLQINGVRLKLDGSMKQVQELVEQN